MSSGREAVIRDLIGEIDLYLGSFTGPGVDDVLAGIVRWKGGPMRDVTPSRIRQTAYIDHALDWMEVQGDRKLARAIRAAMPHLEWQAYDPYPRELVGDVYADNHCMASLIGEGGQIGAEDFDLGLFGFGPNILYRDHQHAAPELYAPLTGPHGWRFQSGQPLDWHSSYHPQWNEPWAQHAFKSGPAPYFCIYCWTKDTSLPANIVEAPDWAVLEADNPFA